MNKRYSGWDVLLYVVVPLAVLAFVIYAGAVYFG